MAKFVDVPDFYRLVNCQPKPDQGIIGHFNIFRVEDLILPAQKPLSYSRRDFFKVSLVHGHSKIHYASQCVEVKDTALVFTNPMIPYHWERISAVHSGYVCIFTEAFFSRFGNIKDYPVFQFPEAAVIPLQGKAVKPFAALFTRMHEELNGDYAYKYDLLRNLLMELIHAAQKMQPAIGKAAAGSNAAERIAGLFADLLERQFPIEMNSQVIQLHTPSDFARQLNVHVNHLNKALKEMTGRTTSQLINMRILREAEILLRNTNWTVNEIATSLGFAEPNHFSSAFRRMGGMTPRQFRQKN